MINSHENDFSSAAVIAAFHDLDIRKSEFLFQSFNISTPLTDSRRDVPGAYGEDGGPSRSALPRELGAHFIQKNRRFHELSEGRMPGAGENRARPFKLLRRLETHADNGYSGPLEFRVCFAAYRNGRIQGERVVLSRAVKPFQRRAFDHECGVETDKIRFQPHDRIDGCPENVCGVSRESRHQLDSDSEAMFPQ